jgi:LysM repeat protein
MKDVRSVLRLTLLMILLPLTSCFGQPALEQEAKPSEVAAEVAALIEALHSFDPVERRNAAHQLGRMGERAAPAIPALIRSLGDRARLTAQGRAGKDSPESVAEAAMLALASLGPPAVEPLVDALKNENPGVRMMAAGALGKIEDTRGLAPLIEVLESDPDPLVQAAVVDALRNKRDASVLEALLLAETNGSWVVRSLAKSAVQEAMATPIGKEDPSSAGQARPAVDPRTAGDEDRLKEVGESVPAPEVADREKIEEAPAPGVGETAPAAEPEASDPARHGTHTVQKDENLYRIGLRYGVPWQTLMEYNGLTDPTELTAGRQLRIPVVSELEGCPGTGSDELTKGADAAGRGPATGEQAYIVQPGDNLYRIGRRFGVPWLALLKHNGLGDSAAVSVGQELRIPAPAGPAGTLTWDGETTYTVQDGDILYEIGLLYGMGWRDIAALNGLSDPDDIFVGQVLKIPTRGESPSP